ncbi:hypothetical protein [Priestia megaterium]|uniref:hypothetical protein n=1 Tax=Priestia megaterium TaxID=1404 RepID=UPI001C533F71|nr:hypothetical protein [Priestia megaterium]MBW0933530.1 hypothetical protein [Priestia megaterium]
MGRSKKPMETAIVIYQEKAERVPPEIALNYRDKEEKPGRILRCPDYFKTGCPALLKVVSGTPPYYALKNGGQSHRGCEYENDGPSFIRNIQEHSDEKLPVLIVKDTDMFSPKKKDNKQTSDKRSSTNTGDKGGRNSSYSIKEYINTVYEFHEFLHNSNSTLIYKVVTGLKNSGLLYEKSDFDKLLKNKSINTVLVQGFLDKREIQLLKDKGYVYLYDKYTKHLDNKTRIMLVHNGEGQEKFKEHLIHLLEWIDSKKAGNRKLATLKGKVKKVYNESKTIVFHVQDLDIKYRVQEWQASKERTSVNTDKYKIKTEPHRDISPKALDSNMTLVRNSENTKTVYNDIVKEKHMPVKQDHKIEQPPSENVKQEPKFEQSSPQDIKQESTVIVESTTKKANSLFTKIRNFCKLGAK